MEDSPDLLCYMSYLRRRWRWIAISCGLAASLALGIGLTLPRKYTATARILIEPPAGTDLRAAMAVSPIYLESLRTYEQFAASDSLFQDALARFHLRADLGAKPIESLKKSILNVELVRSTRILEIAATLPDPRKAQAVAEYMAEATVSLSRSVNTAGDQDLAAGIERQAAELRTRLQRTEAEWASLMAQEPINGLQAAVQNGAELKSKLQQQADGAEQDLADIVERQKHDSPEIASQVQAEAASVRVRLELLRKQIQAADARNAENEKLLAARVSRRDGLDAVRKADQVSLAAAENRVREARNDAGYRGERLRVIDPGVRPERPSSPNVPLDVMVALLLGLLLPMAYYALEMNWRDARAAGRPAAVRSLVRAGNE
jgi:uncharacterized protein involved in exopolysaccharide biosynthesis